jgi:serine/threonine protein kinase
MSESAPHTTFEAPNLDEVIELFPSYEVHSLIACGGMGAVFHATQRSLDRDVAIKILPREFAQDAEFVASFEAEAKSMAKLNHPNLIGVYDFGDAADMLYIVMEFVPGTSLFAAAHGHKVEQTEAIRIVSAVCRGLANAHQYGILHRDIKPSNILLDSNMNPKVGDFGLASKMDKRIEEGEQIFGTPGYTAPEVIDPPHVFDQRADIFSVGVMLYELLTGVTPNGEKPVSALPPVSYPRLHAIIQKATNPNPALRYNSADELANELEKVATVANNPLLAATARKSAKPFVHHRRTIKQSSSGGGFMWLILLILIGAGGYYYYTKIHLPGQKTDKPSDASPAQTVSSTATVQQPTRRKTVAEEGVTPKDDVDQFFVRVEGIMRDRIMADLQNYRQALEQNIVDFETSARQVITGLDVTKTAGLFAELNSAKEAWAKDNHFLPDSLPGTLGNYTPIQQLFIQAQLKQSRDRNRFYSKLQSEQAQYVRGLEKQIRRYKEEQDHIAASLLQKEIARLKSERGYYEFLMAQ